MKKVLVIGAGILGATAAYQLAKQEAEVVVIDGNHEGQATDAAAGIICPWLSQRRNKAWYALAKAGAAYYPSLIEQLKLDGIRDTGYKKVGSLTVHTDEKKLVQVEERAQSRRVDASELGSITKLSVEETHIKFPPLDEKFASIFVSGAARVNGQALRKALLKGAVRYGAKIINGVAKVAKEGDKVIGAFVDDSLYEADIVLVTAGAWAAEVMKSLDINLQIVEQKAQIIHMQLPNTETGNWPVIMPVANQYLLAFEDGKIIAGATHENEPNFDQRPTIGGMADVLQKALETAPGLAEATYIETRVGFRPVAPNFMPIIGAVPNYPNVFLANGLGSSGLTVGPFLGNELAKLALEQEVSIDLQLYNIEQAIE